MKSGGIVSRLSGDVDAVSGLVQMALISPGVAADPRRADDGHPFRPEPGAGGRRQRHVAADGGDQLSVAAAGAANLPFAAGGQLEHRRPRGRDVRRHPCRPRFAAEAGARATLGHHTIIRKRLWAERMELALSAVWGLPFRARACSSSGTAAGCTCGGRRTSATSSPSRSTPCCSSSRCFRSCRR